MNKVLAVIKREYLAAVRRKMFIFMTIFFPVLMAALFIVPTMMMARALGDKKVAVVDGSGQLGDTFQRQIKPERVDPKKALTSRRNNDLPQTLDVTYVDSRGKDPVAVAKPYLDRLNADRRDVNKLDGVLIVPSDAITNTDATLSFYSKSSTDVITQERLGSAANSGVQRHRLIARGVDAASVDALTRRLEVEGVQLSKSGEQKKGGGANFIIGFLFAGLLIIPSFMAGLETMRGIVQEKTDRVVEVLISSMSPRELLTGKILGVALAGLTQVAAWLIIITIAGSLGAPIAAAGGFNLSQFLRPMVYVYFILFFILGYLTFVCVYAVAGAACNSDKEAQQLIAPIQMVMMLPWFVMVGIVTNPDSQMSVGMSLMPVYGPITMFVRTLVSEPPVWHVLASIGVSIVTIIVFFWATAKIFRVGILSYGKRPTIPELLRWIKYA